MRRKLTREINTHSGFTVNHKEHIFQVAHYLKIGKP